MLAACGASRATDAYVASELGALVHSRGLIEDQRWRLEAVVALVPALLRYGVAIHRVRDEVFTGIKVAVCPAELRPPLARLLDRALTDGQTATGAITALWTPHRPGAAFAAVACALGLGATDLAADVAGAVDATDDNLGRRLHRAVATGVLGDRFVARLDPDAPAAYPASLPLLVALVDRAGATGDRAAAAAARTVAAALGDGVTALTRGQLARLAFYLAGAGAALHGLRAIRPRGPRAVAGLGLVRAALDRNHVDDARLFADATESHLYRQRGWLAIAHHLVARGATAPAMRTLARIDHPVLAAERRLLREELALVTRLAGARLGWPPRRQLAGADPAPIDLVRRGWLLHATLAILRGDPDAAAGLLRTRLTDAASRRFVLDLWRRVGIDPRGAVFAMRSRLRPAVVSALWAEHLIARADDLLRWRAPRTASCPAAVAATAGSDTLERALYDEDLARSPAGASRRRVLINAARYCVRAAFAAPGAWPVPVVESRLRSLLYLGGSLGRDAIAGALAIRPVCPALFALGFEALCTLDAGEAARIAVTGAVELARAGVDIDAALVIAEAHGGLPRGFARAWVAARRRLARHLDHRGAIAWLVALDAERRGTGAALTTEVLSWVADRTTIAASPRELLDELDRVATNLATVPLELLAARIAADRDLLRLLLVARPPHVDDRMPAWSLERWISQLERAASPAIGSPDPTVVARCAAALPRAGDALRAGDLARLGVLESIAFTASGEPFRVRLLDKRADVLTYLRFADVPALSCYRSDDQFYLETSYDTQAALLAVWKDPLSFCFHVERGRDRRPCGFVFGGFARARGAVAILLNGLYVRPRRPEVRDGVLRAIETALAPLAIDRFALASEHGGDGHIPPRYRSRAETVTRWRALAIAGDAVQDAYDDISFEVNHPTTLGHLWWHEPAQDLLSTAAGGPHA